MDKSELPNKVYYNEQNGFCCGSSLLAACHCKFGEKRNNQELTGYYCKFGGYSDRSTFCKNIEVINSLKKSVNEAD